jgi:integration host factor subunit alpha
LEGADLGHDGPAESDRKLRERGDMMALTKDMPVKSIADGTRFSKDISADLVETLIELIKRSLASGDDVLVSGFGKFSVKTKRERRGRNPATGDSMMLEQRKVVTFHCSGKLRKKLNPDQAD